VIQRRLGHWDEAIASLRRAVELDPRNVEVSQFSRLRISSSRFSEALSVADGVLAWDDGYNALWAKALVFWSGGFEGGRTLLANPGTGPAHARMQAL